MMLLLGDTVTVMRQINSEPVFITGRVNGIVQKDDGDLKYFYIKGIDSALYVSDGWTFEVEEYEESVERE